VWKMFRRGIYGVDEGKLSRKLRCVTVLLQRIRKITWISKAQRNPRKGIFTEFSEKNDAW
jgi:hypothetical protein